MDDIEIKLRAMEPEDAEMMYDAEGDPDAWRYSDYFAPLSREMLRNYAMTYDADPFRSGQLRLIICIDGNSAGILDLFDISPRHLRADSGIYLLPAYRGNGAGTKVLDTAKEFCRERLGLHQITASISESNHAAMRCYEKAGFLSSGIRPDWLRTPDGWEDIKILSVKL